MGQSTEFNEYMAARNQMKKGIKIEKPEEPTKNELWYINRWENWNRMALINTRDAIKKANADLKLLNLEKDFIRNIKKKWKA